MCVCVVELPTPKFKGNRFKILFLIFFQVSTRLQREKKWFFVGGGDLGMAASPASAAPTPEGKTRFKVLQSRHLRSQCNARCK